MGSSQIMLYVLLSFAAIRGDWSKSHGFVLCHRHILAEASLLIVSAVAKMALMLRVSMFNE